MVRRSKMKKEKLLMLVLGVCLLMSLVYIATSAYKTSQQNKITSAFTQGFTQGYNKGMTDTITKVYQETDACKPVPIFVGEDNKNIIDIACLQTTE